MERIFIMLSGSFHEGFPVFESASREACYPERLTFCLASREKLSRAQLKRLKALGVVRLAEPESGDGGAQEEDWAGDGSASAPLPWQAAFALWQGEEYALKAAAGLSFSRHWDLFLLKALRRCFAVGGNEKAALTGYPPRAEDPYDAFCPVAAQGFDEAGRLRYHRGVPLQDASRPQRAAFLHPDFLFAPAAFFHQTGGDPEGEPMNLPWSMRAFHAGFSLFTLNQPLIRSDGGLPVPPENWMLYPPEKEGTLLSQFEYQFGFRTGARKLSASARLGLYTPDLQFDVHTPLPVKGQEAWRRFQLRKSPLQPLCVTAYREMAGPVRCLEEEYESRFHHLARLSQLALVCYTRPPMSGKIRPYFANLYEYQNRYGLPMDVLWEPEEDFNQFSAGKVFLMRRSMNTFPHHSHYCWIDFGYQRWPLYFQSALDWRRAAGDTIHIARVEGALDTSFFSVPRDLVAFLADEMLKEAERSHGNGPLEPDHVLMARVYAQFPRQFTLHDLPAARRLFTKTLLKKEEAFHAHP